MAQARGEASNLLYRINSDIAMRFTQRRNNFNESAGEFVMAMQLGLASVMSAYSKGGDLMGKIAECSRLSVELSDVRNLCNLNSTDSTTTVVAMPVGYVVHSGDTLSTHTDETLPEDLKGPLGMLKLTEAGTVLPMGIRINDTVFVIRTEGESDVA
jgi:hypothetical protein